MLAGGTLWGAQGRLLQCSVALPCPSNSRRRKAPEFHLVLDSLGGLPHTHGCSKVLLRAEPSCPRREGGDLSLEMGDKSKRGFGQHFHLLPPEDPALPGHFPSGFWLYSGCVQGRVAGMARRLQLLEEWQLWCHFLRLARGTAGSCGSVAGVWVACAGPGTCVCPGVCTQGCQFRLLLLAWLSRPLDPESLVPSPGAAGDGTSDPAGWRPGHGGKTLGTACGLLGAPMVGLGDFSPLE